MKIKGLWEALLRIGLSLAFGGILYLLWMGAFLMARDLESPILEPVGWLLAPVVTAVGFTIGIRLGEGRLRGHNRSFLRVAIWPLTGCAIGAWSVYWLGPMLIVFGMLAAGTASVALREWVLWRRGHESGD